MCFICLKRCVCISVVFLLAQVILVCYTSERILLLFVDLLSSGIASQVKLLLHIFVCKHIKWPEKLRRYAPTKVSPSWLLTFDNGPMVLWSNGPMDQCTIGPMDQWNHVPMGQWTNGTLEHWNIGTLEHRNTATLENWNIGTLEHLDIRHSISIALVHSDFFSPGHDRLNLQ